MHHAHSNSFHSSTVEQYVKTIYLQSQAELRSGTMVAMGVIVQAMEVAPSTTTAMVKFLAKEGLAEYTPRAGVALTPMGEKLALQVLRRHRLIETFLHAVLGYDWSEVHADAEQLEHAASTTFVDRLDAFLGYPNFDPHGAPIPSHSGAIRHHILIPLSDCAEGRFRIAQIETKDARLLQHLKGYHLMPGALCTILHNDSILAAIELETNNGTALSMSYHSARCILVHKEGTPGAQTPL